MTPPISGPSPLMGTSQSLNPVFPEITSVATKSLEEIKLSLVSFSPVERKVWADSQDKYGKTSLAHAVEAHSDKLDRLDIIRYLIEECKADVNKSDRDQWTPLYRCATGAKHDVLSYLILAKAEINLANNSGSTPLHRAVDRRGLADVHALLNADANPDAVNTLGTPLAYAAKNGDLAMAELLIGNGAKFNLVDDPLGATPLELARSNNRQEMANFLSSQGAVDEIPRGSSIHTAVSQLSFTDDQEAILDSFKKGDKDEFGRTVAHYCASLGRTDLLEKMQQLGSVDTPDEKGCTPVYYAIMKGKEKAALYLLGDVCKCSLNHQDKEKATPLIWACQFQRLSLVKAILEIDKARGKPLAIQIDGQTREVRCINIQDKYSWKAIHKVSQNGNLEIFKLLVEFGANPFEATDDGRTPLHRAVDSNAQAVISYIDDLLKEAAKAKS